MGTHIRYRTTYASEYEGHAATGVRASAEVKVDPPPRQKYAKLS